jgi:hypothetical protein
MENHNSEAAKWMTLADANQRLNSNQSGDFTNSAELSEGLAHVSNMIVHHNSLGMAPDKGMNAMPNVQSGQMPSGMPSGNPGSIPGAMPTSMPGGNYLSGMPVPTPSTDMVSGYVNPRMNMMANPSVSAAPQGTGSMPKQEVLMEPCTINQPINSSLRENFSTGNFYFLPKS